MLVCEVCPSHVRKRDKRLLRGILSGGVWNGFSLVQFRGEIVPFVFVVDLTVMVTCLGIVITQYLSFSGNPEFASVISHDNTHWPRCLLWHGCLLSLSGNLIDSPSAINPADGMFKHLETCLGPYCPDMIDQW